MIKLDEVKIIYLTYFIFKQEQDKNEIPEEILKECHPQDVDSSFHGANRDLHTAYYGEIVSAY